MSDPEFLLLEDVSEIHSTALARHGGVHGTRDQGSLLSAIAQPTMGYGGTFFHEDVFAMAAAYAYHLSENQPFLDGNKRTGIGAAFLFLSLNGFPLDSSGDRAIYVALMQIAKKEHEDPKKHLATIFRQLATGTAERLADEDEL